MKVNYEIEVDAKVTETDGQHTYLVATCCGGIMECPEIYYENYNIIKADSKEEAVAKYNELNRCSYFYGGVIKQIN